MHVAAVNISAGRVVDYAGKAVETGIFKDSVAHAVHVHRLGLAGGLRHAGQGGRARADVGVHPLLGDDFPQIPAWLNEGIAALYGSARAGKRGFEFLVNYRLRDLQKALKAGDLPTVDQLAASTADDVRGPRAMTWYAMARYVLGVEPLAAH